MYIACAIVNESLYDKNADKKKVVNKIWISLFSIKSFSFSQHNSFQVIQYEWFRISSQKNVNGRLVEGYLNSIKEHFSNFLLERIVNLQDANVRFIFWLKKKLNSFFFVSIREILHFIIVLPMVIGMLLICY